MNTKSKIHALRISGGITQMQPAEGVSMWRVLSLRRG